MSIHEEIPIGPDIRSFVNLPQHVLKDTGRRFDKFHGRYIEVERETPDRYETAQFGECVLDYEKGTHRIQQVTIIYARVLRFKPMQP